MGAMGYRTLLQGPCELTRVGALLGHQHRDPSRRDGLAKDEPLYVCSDGERLRTLVGAAPEAHFATGRTETVEHRCHSGHKPKIRPSYALCMGTIDWRLAQRVGEMVAGASMRPSGGSSAPAASADVGFDLVLESLQTQELASRITAYTGLQPHDRLPSLELIDRPRWIAANLKSAKPLLEPLTDRMGSGLGPLAGMARSASGAVIGVQVGALTGMLSQRVLGQYDIALLDVSSGPRLLLLAPNLAQAAHNLDVDREELTRWVTIHEVTHAIQFGAAPWLRDHLAELLRELMESMQVSVSKQQGFALRDLFSARDLPQRADVAAARDRLAEIVAKARSGELLRITLGEDRWRLIDRMQATMSLIEGHAEHVMDAVGAELLPSLPRLRAAMDRRRQMRPLPWRVLERLLGLELKLRQYEVGRRFCDVVTSEAGPRALAPAWRSAEGLPTSAELEAPLSWLARTA
jgi:coenzyme F420 biosynthesis associated uncharacterized protein